MTGGPAALSEVGVRDKEAGSRGRADRAVWGGGAQGRLTWMTTGSSFPSGRIWSITRGAARYCFSPRITLAGIPSSRLKSASNREPLCGEEEGCAQGYG